MINNDNTNEALIAAAMSVKTGIPVEEKATPAESLNEEETIEELSKKTLGSYVQKASRDQFKNGVRTGSSNVKSADTGKLDNKHAEASNDSMGKAMERDQGIKTAVKKLTKEEIERIEKTLESLGESVEVISEGANDHEDLHKKILKDVHKHYPEMNVNKSKHVGKHTDPHGHGEFHTYEADIPVHDSVKHLFKSLKAKTTISHHKDGHHASTEYAYDHHDYGGNGKAVASHFSDKDTGKHHLRCANTHVTKEMK